MAIIEALRPHLAAMQARAEALDEAAAFPEDDMATLRMLGIPAIPLPRAHGGEGVGTEPGGGPTLLELLRLLGQANASLGRIVEAHINAVRLIIQFGTAEQALDLCRLCREGDWIGLWVTDAPGQPLGRAAGILSGAKGPCSAAGHLRHALVTVSEGNEVRMALVHLTGREPVEPLGDRLHGMRAAGNGVIHLGGLPLPDSAIIGGDGDYLREPDLSAGAWRTMAVTTGLLDALVDATRRQLRTRGHDAAPLQQARFGEMLIAQGTARLWTEQAATIAETGAAPGFHQVADQVAAVNLARIAVESACFEAMRHAQRALGLGALVRPNPVERLLRDLTTYLRQPAPDAVLTEAAQHALARP